MLPLSAAHTRKSAQEERHVDRYVYRGSSYTPGRLVEELIRTRVASPGARGMDIEDALDQIAEANGIDRDTVSSDEFPKLYRP